MKIFREGCCLIIREGTNYGIPLFIVVSAIFIFLIPQLWLKNHLNIGQN